MKIKIYRIFAAVTIITTAILFSAAVFLQSTLPDIYRKSPNEDFRFSSAYGNLIFCNSSNSETKAAFGTNSAVEKAELSFLGIIPIKTVSVAAEEDKIVTVCGTPFGVKMFTEGVLVVGFSKIRSSSGLSCPAEKSGICENDVIYEIDGEKVSTNEDVSECIDESLGKEISMLIGRNGENLVLRITPEKSAENGSYKTGMWIRDSSAGIGTLTFYDPETSVFAGLGHAICDVDTGGILPLSKGELVRAEIKGIKKSSSGKPGELCGNFSSEKGIGDVKINNESGLYGKLSSFPDGTDYPIAHKQEIREGEVTVISTVSGKEPQEYSAVIDSINFSDETGTKNMVIKITDSNLIEQTGGIVQGMSGSPIIQDGKLIGAVTHVFINDPIKGYAIFAENMYDMSISVK